MAWFPAPGHVASLDLERQDFVQDYFTRDVAHPLRRTVWISPPMKHGDEEVQGSFERKNLAMSVGEATATR